MLSTIKDDLDDLSMQYLRQIHKILIIERLTDDLSSSIAWYLGQIQPFCN